MPRVSRISEAPPQAVEQALAELGQGIRVARQSRGMTLDALAERVGTSRFVMADIEAGKATTAVAAYLGALWALDRLPAFRFEQEALPTPPLAMELPAPAPEDVAGDWMEAIAAIPGEAWNRARVARGLLSLARGCGLRVVDSRLSASADADVLLVNLDAHRLPVRTVGAADGADASYLVIADRLRQRGVDTRADLRELFGRICFHAVVACPDTGSGLVLDAADGCRLAPMFVDGVSPPAGAEARHLGLECGREGTIATRANLLSASGRFLLGTAEAQGVLDGIAQTVTTQWQLAMRRAGVSEADCGRIATAFGSL